MRSGVGNICPLGHPKVQPTCSRDSAGMTMSRSCAESPAHSLPWKPKTYENACSTQAQSFEAPSMISQPHHPYYSLANKGNRSPSHRLMVARLDTSENSKKKQTMSLADATSMKVSHARLDLSLSLFQTRPPKSGFKPCRGVLERISTLSSDLAWQPNPWLRTSTL